jgi:hypothetical protein
VGQWGACGPSVWDWVPSKRHRGDAAAQLQHIGHAANVNTGAPTALPDTCLQQRARSRQQVIVSTAAQQPTCAAPVSGGLIRPHAL